MAEELRFFLRTAVYAAVLGVIYWFVSYEVAGSVLLAAVVIAALAFIVVVGALVRHSRDEIVPPGSSGVARVGAAVFRTLGFDERHGSTSDEPLAAGLEPIPARSMWPLMAGVGALLVALGLVYGPWLLLPGLVMIAGTIWGWVTQLDAR